VGERAWTEAASKAAFAELGDRLIDATRRYNRSARRQRIQADLYTVGGRELTPAQVDLLEAVAAAGALRMHEVAHRLGVDPSTATRTSAPVVDLGLLDRSTDPDNRRFVVLRCTKAGSRTAARITQARRRLMREVLADMAPERRLLLAELLDEYSSLLEQHEGGPDRPPVPRGQLGSRLPPVTAMTSPVT
jgi:DNA-binding MarR family transcriptional regulator